MEEETLIKAYTMAWNVLLENRDGFMEKWKGQMQSENLLERYRVEKFMEYTEDSEKITGMNTDFILKTLDHIRVCEDGTLVVVLLEGMEFECRNEED